MLYHITFRLIIILDSVILKFRPNFVPTYHDITKGVENPSENSPNYIPESDTENLSQFLISKSKRPESTEKKEAEKYD